MSLNPGGGSKDAKERDALAPMVALTFWVSDGASGLYRKILNSLSLCIIVSMPLPISK
jgi:hypothetical protein